MAKRRCPICGACTEADGRCSFAGKSPWDCEGNPDFARATLHSAEQMGLTQSSVVIAKLGVVRDDCSPVVRAAWRIRRWRVLGHLGLWIVHRAYDVPMKPDEPPPPIPDFEELLTGSDSDLCDGAWSRAGRHFGPRGVETPDYPPAAKTVRIVWGCMGVIDNGGFEYLFEGDIDDFGCSDAAAAFETIGCREAAAAFREAFALFPSGTPPRDRDERIATYRQTDEGVREAINRRFWQEGWDKNIERSLAKFIRERADEFRTLD